MIITDFIKRPGDGRHVCNYVSLVFDNDYRVNDYKIIKRKDNSIFLAPPQKKITKPCLVCHTSNCIDANFCNQCGNRLVADKAEYYDLFHPINSTAREYLEETILKS